MIQNWIEFSFRHAYIRDKARDGFQQSCCSQLCTHIVHHEGHFCEPVGQIAWSSLSPWKAASYPRQRALSSRQCDWPGLGSGDLEKNKIWRKKTKALAKCFIQEVLSLGMPCEVALDVAESGNCFCHTFIFRQSILCDALSCRVGKSFSISVNDSLIFFVFWWG